MDDLAWMDATAQASLVRDGEATPEELVEAAIARIERVNPALNAVVRSMFDEAREAAAAPRSDAPFRGVPFLIKDLLAAWAGLPLTEGSAFLRDFVPDVDAELVARQREAGLIVVGKTNTPEFGILGTTEPALFGPTVNPWDPRRSTGGSSGGSAAAVAAGLVPMAHANDGGGSIRIPASCCGVFGLKPTRGRNPLGIDASGLVAEHAVTRSVRDSAALLDATSAFYAENSSHAPAPERAFAGEVGREPGRLRVAFSRTAPIPVRVHPDCVAAVEDAAALCERLGHDVEEAAPSFAPERLENAFDIVWSAGIAQSMQAWSRRLGRPITPDAVEPLSWAVLEKGRAVSAVDYQFAIEDLHALTAATTAFHERFDLWLTPTLSAPPVPLGYIDMPPEDPLRGYRRDAEFCAFTPLQNCTGQPAMSVPLWWNDQSLPIGVQFAARFGDEATLFRLAAQLEAERPWAGRRPPISA
ncbi:MAG TPA: amidase [Actinomycetota bacterium]